MGPDFLLGRLPNNPIKTRFGHVFSFRSFGPINGGRKFVGCFRPDDMKFNLIFCSCPRYMENRSRSKVSKSQHSRRCHPGVPRNDTDNHKDRTNQDCPLTRFSSTEGLVPQNTKNTPVNQHSHIRSKIVPGKYHEKYIFPLLC